MGAQSIPTRTNGQTINESFFNLLQQVLDGDIVPRSGGAANNLAGSLGQSTFRFNVTYTRTVDTDTTLRLDISGSNIIEMDADGINRDGVKPRAVALNADPGKTGIAFSDEISFTGSTGTVTDSETDLTISPQGGPLLIGIVPGDGTAATRGTVSGTGDFEFRINNTRITMNPEPSSSGGPDIFNLGQFTHIYPNDGTIFPQFTGATQITLFSNSTLVNFNAVRVFVKEM